MTIEQAESELMQIYGALASNKQIAIDTLVKASVKPQEPKSEWEHGYEILKANSDGANEVLDEIRAEIEKLQTYVLCKGDMKKIELADVLEIVDKYRVKSEENRGINMGTIRNEMTIVHHWNWNELEQVRKDAIEVFTQVIRRGELVAEEYVENMISPIMETYINKEYTFVINGECSKIGWETSERFHEARMQWCEKHKHDVQNIIVINFGEDDDPCRIVFDNKTEGEGSKHV